MSDENPIMTGENRSGSNAIKQFCVLTGNPVTTSMAETIYVSEGISLKRIRHSRFGPIKDRKSPMPPAFLFLIPTMSNS